MSNHNYKQYYNNKSKEKPYTTEKPVEIKKPIEPVVEEAAVETVESVKVEAPKPAEPVIGKVVGCKMLNIRIAPRKFADVVTVVYADSELVIDLDKSKEDWYSVCTASGVDGFCMRQFVEINK